MRRALGRQLGQSATTAWVMSSKGFGTRAAKDFIDKLAEHDEPVERVRP